MSFQLFGSGLVRGITRLAFKASAVACGGSSPTSDLTGGNAVGLSSANTAGEISVCIVGFIARVFVLQEIVLLFPTLITTGRD